MPSAFMTNSTESTARIILIILVRIDAPLTPITQIIRLEKRSSISVMRRMPIVINAAPKWPEEKRHDIVLGFLS